MSAEGRTCCDYGGPIILWVWPSTASRTSRRYEGFVNEDGRTAERRQQWYLERCNVFKNEGWERYPEF